MSLDVVMNIKFSKVRYISEFKVICSVEILSRYGGGHERLPEILDVRVICNTLDAYLFTDVLNRKYHEIFLNMKPP